MQPATVSAVILSYNRKRELAVVLDRLRALPVDEIVVVDDSENETAEFLREQEDEKVNVIRPGKNLGIAGRNLAAGEAKGEFLLLLDDDSYPLDGAIEKLLDAFSQAPRLGVVGGLVRDVDEEHKVTADYGLGSFDWFLRAGHEGEPPPQGFPAFFFPEGGCMFRRKAFLEADGFFEPFFHACTEIDLATRLLGLGWDVRYLPTAIFDHMKARPGRAGPGRALYFRIRNHLWYLWLRFPPFLAARRTVGYLAFDLLECLFRGAPSAWPKAIADAWRKRESVRPYRDPLPRAVIRRAELNRGRMHVRLLLAHAQRRLSPS